MAVYVDPLFVMESRNAQAHRVGARNGHRWCHLFADTPAELCEFALRIGMRLEWFQLDEDGGHFDLTPSRRAAAVKLGAIEVSTRDAVRIWRVLRAFHWRHRLKKEHGVELPGGALRRLIAGHKLAFGACGNVAGANHCPACEE